ncbi:hypothetical protein BGZ96_009235 [Linnemannia gamsii]|uniref:3'-5' exonuclease n=1 Tax=Linnemannia gamsii TaxID=64522 RepID=A0ABQ7KDU1_9FUNG|nr:hypothetical protein BGZ96_009235 [Linnemannia gamsii]
MSVASTAHSAITRIALASRTTSILFPRCYHVSSLRSLPSSYPKSKLSTLISHRSIHTSEPRLQYPQLNVIRHMLSSARTRGASSSPSSSSSSSATTFWHTETTSQRVASLSTRKVATLTSTAHTKTGIESAPSLLTSTSRRPSRRILLSSSPQLQQQQQKPSSNTTRASVASETTATVEPKAGAGVPRTTTVHRKKIFLNWLAKAPPQAKAFSGSEVVDSNYVNSRDIINDSRSKSRGKRAGEPSPSPTTASTIRSTAFQPYDHFSLPKPPQIAPATTKVGATTQTRIQNSEPLPFLDFRTNDSREVMYTKCDVEADQWLNSNPSKMWALDAEWKVFGVYGKQAKMSLIQLGDDRAVYLFHVIHMKKFPEALARILQDKSIFKVGINIRNDATKMFKDWGVGCSSLVELGALSIQVQDDLPTQRKIRSMERLSRELLQHAVEKVPLTRMGNWESKNLSANQIAYAANDVFVTYELAEKIKELQKMRPKKDYVVPLATVHSNGTTVITVRGSLQERVDHPATAKDIIVPEPKQAYTILKARATAGGAKRSSVGYAKVTKVKIGGSGPTTIRKTTGVAPVQAPTSSTTTTGRSTKSAATAASYTWGDLLAHGMNVNGYPYHFYKNVNNKGDLSSKVGDSKNVIRTIRLGSRSTVTIIPPRFQKRSFSSTSLAATADKKVGAKDVSQRGQQGQSREVYFPSQLLPESLEGKDNMERNQSVWLEAGGRDLSEDDLEEEGGEQQDDWYLRQNQALFASLVPPDSDFDNGSDVGSDVGVNGDALAALIRKRL